MMRNWFASFFGFTCLVWIVFLWIGVGWANQGALLYLRSNIESQALGYPKTKESLLQESLGAYQKASKMRPSDRTIQWGYGRVALALGENRAASSVLSASDATPDDPLRFLDTIKAHSRNGDESAVLMLYQAYQENPFGIHSQVISDTVALIFMQQAQEQIRSGQIELALPALENAHSFRPFDLFVNYHLWRNASQSGDLASADVYREILVNAPKAAISPDDERLLDYAAEILLELGGENLWGLDRSQNVVKYWIWQFPHSPALRLLLERATMMFPNQPGWRSLLREVEERTSGLTKAEKVDVTDQQTVAVLLGVPAQAVTLGSNLIKGETFADRDQRWPVEGWRFSVADSPRHRPFATGPDFLEPPGSIRLSDLWWPRVESDLLFTPYAEYWGYDIASQPEWLMASLWYKAEGGQGMFILGDPGTGNFWSHLYLPDTAGKWMHMLVVGERPPVHNVPILRNLGAANVWFQDVQVRAVNLQSAASSCRQEICVRFTQ